MKMDIGQRITVTEIMYEKIGEPTRKMATKEVDPIECVYLGTGQRWDGEYHWEYADEDSPYDNRFWVNTKCHNCHIVQPLDKGGRYRKPLAVPLAADAVAVADVES